MSVIGRGLDNGMSCNTILYPEAVVALKLTFTWKLCFATTGLERSRGKYQCITFT